MPAHRTQNSRYLRVEANPVIGAPELGVISPTPQTFVFSSIPESSTRHPLPVPEASRSLPNLGCFTTFHVNSNSEYAQSGSQSSMYLKAESPISGASTSSFFISPTSSVYSGSSPGSPGSSHCPSPSPFNDNGEYRRPRSSSHSSIAPYPLPQQFETKSNGQQRTQPPRPPNPWICFRNWKTEQYKNGELKYPDIFPKAERGRSAPSSPATGILGLDGDTGRRPRQADLSKYISQEWKSLTEEQRAPFIRMSEEAKLEHQRRYPDYKYQPRRKTDAKKNGLPTLKDSKSRSPSTSRSPSKRPTSRARPQVTKQEDDEELCDIKVDLSEQMSMAMHQFDMSVAQFDMSELGVEVGQGPSQPQLHFQTDGHTETIVNIGEGGDPEKDWTFLPEQTLIPPSWGNEPDANAVLGDVRNPDINADEREEEDMEFRKPLYLWFSPSDSDSSNNGQQSNTNFLPAESSSDSAALTAEPEPFFDFGALAVPSNFTFPETSSLGFHFDGFPAFSMDDLNQPELRRDSVSSVDSYDVPGSNEMYGNLADGMNALGFSASDMMDTSSMEYAPAFQDPIPQPVDFPRRSPTPSLRIDTQNVPAFRPPSSPRRASISSETVYKSADGMLCPPVMTHRRSKTLSVSSRAFASNLASSSQTPSTSTSSTALATPASTSTGFKSIPTQNTFGGSIMTSVLVPKVMDHAFERDLEAYSQTLSNVAPSETLSKALKLSPAATREKTKSRSTSMMNQNLEEGDLDINAEFDFEAEFGDMICMDAIRAPPSSS